MEDKKAWVIMPRIFLGGGGNSVLYPPNGDRSFWISYNGNREVCSISMFNADDDSGETAICDDRNPERTLYFILRGDFREVYERLIDEGVRACIAFYESKPELQSSWSSDVPIEKFAVKLIEKLSTEA